MSVTIRYVECAHCGATVGDYYVTCPYCGCVLVGARTISWEGLPW
jgi:DNA-directed RNA polymerase subunit RPC12/RpoP